MSFAGMVPVQPMIRANRVRALAVTSGKRVAPLPEVPTVAEAGLPGYEVVGWCGVLAPAGVPRPIVDRLNAEIVRILKLPETTERLESEGAEIIASSADQFQRFLRSDLDKWAKLVKATGAKPD